MAYENKMLLFLISCYYDMSIVNDNKGGFMRFIFRGFTSLALAFSFIMITVTGLVLYIVPPGRVANWIDWRILGMSKEQWGAVHTIFSFLFVVISVIHIIYNWRTLLSYLKDRIRKSYTLRAELAASLALTIIVFAGTLFEIPPFSTTMDIGSSFKESWDTGGVEAPAPHTELKTLEEVVGELDMDIDRVMNRLDRHNIIVTDPASSLKEIAEDNGISPNELYDILQRRGGGGGGGDGGGRNRDMQGSEH